jgi:lipopolysaccharide transport system ATP-binding protein
MHFNSARPSDEDETFSGSDTGFCCEVNELLLVAGRYRINVAIWADGDVQDHVEAAALFDVEEGVLRGRRAPSVPGAGAALMPHRWRRSG